MARHVITAPADLDLASTLDGPLVYLIGPIQGASNWQADAIEILGDLAPDLHVASARSSDFRGGPDKHLVWEQTFLKRASKYGVILFWCARETRHQCDRSYAAQMRFELGELAVKSSAGLARLVVGIERGFTGGPYLRRRFTLTYQNIPVCKTLRQSCTAAMELAQSEQPMLIYPELSELFRPVGFGAKNNG